MAASFVSATQGAVYREAMSKARNKSLSADERKYWLEQARAEAEAIREAQKTLERDALQKLKAELSAQTGLNKYFIGEKAIIDAISLDARYSNQQERANIEEAYNKLVQENKARLAEVEKNFVKTETTYNAGVAGGMSYERIKLAGYDEAMAAAEERNQQRLRANADLIVKYNLLFRKSDEALKEVYATAQSAVAARNQLAEITTSTNEVDASLRLEMEKTTTAARKAATEVAKVKQEYASMVAFVKANPINTRVTPITGDTYSAVKSGKEMKDELPAPINFLTGKSRIEMLDTEGLHQKFVDYDIEKKTAEFENMNEVVGTLGDSFKQLGSAIGGSAGNMLTFVGSIFDAIQAIIPFISYLYAESAAHKANASASATEGASKAMSAYAGIPFAGIPLGLAAVAAIIAAVQSVPKFAEGGIVTSATMGIFGEAGPEAVMPLDKLNEFITPRELRVTGDIKASGKELVVVLDNYNRVRNG